MTGDIPPANLVDYICTRLTVSTKAPKQQHWQQGILGKNQFGKPVPVWFPTAGPAPPQAAWQECALTGLDGASHRYTFAQGGDGTVYWAEMPPSSA